MENTNPTIENLRSNSLFKYISDNDLLNISKTLKEETFSAGTIIFNEKTPRRTALSDSRRKSENFQGHEIRLWRLRSPVLGKGDFFRRDGIDRGPGAVGENHCT